jgi:hypothetical protein
MQSVAVDVAEGGEGRPEALVPVASDVDPARHWIGQRPGAPRPERDEAGVLHAADELVPPVARDQIREPVAVVVFDVHEEAELITGVVAFDRQVCHLGRLQTRGLARHQRPAPKDAHGALVLVPAGHPVVIDLSDDHLGKAVAIEIAHRRDPAERRVGIDLGEAGPGPHGSRGQATRARGVGRDAEVEQRVPVRGARCDTAEARGRSQKVAETVPVEVADRQPGAEAHAGLAAPSAEAVGKLSVDLLVRAVGETVGIAQPHENGALIGGLWDGGAILAELNARRQVETPIAVEVADGQTLAGAVAPHPRREHLPRLGREELPRIAAVEVDRARVPGTDVRGRRPDREVDEAVAVEIGAHHRSTEVVATLEAREYASGERIEAGRAAAIRVDCAPVEGRDVGLGDADERVGRTVAVDVARTRRDREEARVARPGLRIGEGRHDVDRNLDLGAGEGIPDVKSCRTGGVADQRIPVEVRDVAVERPHALARAAGDRRAEAAADGDGHPRGRGRQGGLGARFERHGNDLAGDEVFDSDAIDARPGPDQVVSQGRERAAAAGQAHEAEEEGVRPPRDLERDGRTVGEHAGARGDPQVIDDVHGRHRLAGARGVGEANAVHGADDVAREIGAGQQIHETARLGRLEPEAISAGAAARAERPQVQGERDGVARFDLERRIAGGRTDRDGRIGQGRVLHGRVRRGRIGRGHVRQRRVRERCIRVRRIRHDGDDAGIGGRRGRGVRERDRLRVVAHRIRWGRGGVGDEGIRERGRLCVGRVVVRGDVAPRQAQVGRRRRSVLGRRVPVEGGWPGLGSGGRGADVRRLVTGDRAEEDCT